MKYWIGRNNQQLGPYELTEVQRMVVEGRVAVTDLAWTEGMPSWAPVSQVIPGAAPASAADLGKTQPVLSRQAPVAPVNPTPVAPVAPVEPIPAAAAPVWTPPTSAPTPTQPVWTPPAAAQPVWTPPASAPSPVQPQQQYYAPAPQQYAPQAAYRPPAATSGPIPPGMNWVVVLLLCMIPFFAIYWFYKEFSFVKQIDPKNKSLMLFFAYFGMIVLYLVFLFAGLMIGDTMAMLFMGLGGLCMLGGIVCVFLAIFQARSSLLYYYNNVENIGLKLSPVMTFFFSLYYFQYHFQRIAEWKAGGPLRPQA